MSRRVFTNLMVFTLGFVVMLVWLASNIVSFKRVDRPFEVSADFANAFGVLPNAEVAYLGVKFGRVSSVERRPGGVRVGMEIERDREIPANATAHIFRKSAIGEQYIDFSVDPESEPTTAILGQGDHLPVDRTTVPLEFSELLRSAAGLFAAISPDDVATVLSELSAGLNGRAESLRQLAVAGDEVTAALASRTDALDRLATNGARLTRAFATHRGSLGQSLTDLRQISESLRNAKGDTGVLLTRGRLLIDQLGSLIAAHKADLDCDLKVLELVVDRTTTPTKLAGLRALVRFGPQAFANVWDVRDVEADGVWIRVGFLANPTTNPPKQYVPERTLPDVPAPAPCTSPLRPSSLSYKPGSLATGTPLGRNGPPAAIVSVLIAASAAIALRGSVRQTP